MELSINGLVKDMVTNDIFLATSLNTQIRESQRCCSRPQASNRDAVGAGRSYRGHNFCSEEKQSIRPDRMITRSWNPWQTSVQMLTSVTKFVLP
ncbi:MAG: hypothetical protein AMDU5_GPLC00017G0082 [Thermoplasmatales archaeon Gpl]|nr:MAG: hypothetical protein AMDU5_GPLC00017G0082 [Thermoplasmatales archaeon Gpl]